MKIPESSWVPMAIGAVFFTLMITWKTGHSLLLKVEVLPQHFYKVTVSYGVKDETNLPRDLKLCHDKGFALDLMDTSFLWANKFSFQIKINGWHYGEKIYLSAYLGRLKRLLTNSICDPIA